MLEPRNDERSRYLTRIHNGMNLIKGTRVGWEGKQRYTDWLAKMAAEGHLTSEEYEARMEWVDKARTEDELRVAFIDLPRIPLTPRPEPQRKRPPLIDNQPLAFLRSPAWTGCVATFEWFIFALGISTGQTSTMLIGLFFAMFFTAITIVRMKG
jgi:Domain of unknown function (DUF1707)